MTDENLKAVEGQILHLSWSGLEVNENDSKLILGIPFLYATLCQLILFGITILTDKHDNFLFTAFMAIYIITLLTQISDGNECLLENLIRKRTEYVEWIFNDIGIVKIGVGLYGSAILLTAMGGVAPLRASYSAGTIDINGYLTVLSLYIIVSLISVLMIAWPLDKMMTGFYVPDSDKEYCLHE